MNFRGHKYSICVRGLATARPKEEILSLDRLGGCFSLDMYKHGCINFQVLPSHPQEWTSEKSPHYGLRRQLSGTLLMPCPALSPGACAGWTILTAFRCFGREAATSDLQHVAASLREQRQENARNISSFLESASVHIQMCGPEKGISDLLWLNWVGSPCAVMARGTTGSGRQLLGLTLMSICTEMHCLFYLWSSAVPYLFLCDHIPELSSSWSLL